MSFGMDTTIGGQRRDIIERKTKRNKDIVEVAKSLFIHKCCGQFDEPPDLYEVAKSCFLVAETFVDYQEEWLER